MFHGRFWNQPDALLQRPANPRALSFSRERESALLFRTLATLRTDIALFDDVEQLRWNGRTSAFARLGDAAVTETKRFLGGRSPERFDSSTQT